MMAVAFLILFNKYNFIYVIVVFGIEKLCVCVFMMVILVTLFRN